MVLKVKRLEIIGCEDAGMDGVCVWRTRIVPGSIPVDMDIGHRDTQMKRFICSSKRDSFNILRDSTWAVHLGHATESSGLS